MKREIKNLKRLGEPCCPGHDEWPAWPSKHGSKCRRRAKALEHRYVRHVMKRITRAEVMEA
ncbi:hypothetical protein [Hyphomicrobium sp.]|uniref:hypothetical protein n=1 Tax=Hyphomicrobium sp. TaxID=82 RepID=UPI001D9FF69C|nr:hypothetical protein [Hyphomicrobium sp.]MBY0561539.1 hypothetical protein [Hyphomicrobium sp.]